MEIEARMSTLLAQDANCRYYLSLYEDSVPQDACDECTTHYRESEGNENAEAYATSWFYLRNMPNRFLRKAR